MDLINLLFSYNGRINRAKYWIAVLVYVILVLVIMAIVFAVPLIGLIVAVIGYIVMIVSGIMVGIKRLHDRDKSGWWIVVFYGVPMVLSALSAAINYQLDEESSGLGMILSLVGFAITIWAFVELGCLRGTIGPNQYGPDPVAPKPAQH